MKIKQLLKYKLGALLVSSAVLLGGCTITEITSSTSGTLDAVTPDVTLNRFVDVRLASIQQEAAKGQGENLDALAELMGKENKQEFSLWMHTHYDVLFSGLEQPSQLLTRIKTQESNLI